MTEDLDFYVSEINNRLIYLLGVFEEQQLLNGAGTGTTVTGLLNRSGIQTETGASLVDNADAVFRAITKVTTGSGLDADGIVIHPTDYQAFRLKKDANQYYGGGFFNGEYGVGGIPMRPPLWGLPTVVTPAIAAGTVLVGAFKQSATVYRKGGVRVESTNSHASDFTSNLVTTRVEERVALACRVPAGFVKLTLGTT
jgi:HK97 family phage major capsid protein